MDSDKPPSPLVGFTPLKLDFLKEPSDPQELLESNITRMQRRRAWSDKENNPGIKSQLGEIGSKYIENLLASGNATIIEIGGGHLEASKELARTSASSRIIVVEPFVDQADLLGKPANLTVIPKFVEDIMANDIAMDSADAVFCAGNTLNYIKDKLACFLSIWKMLKPGGKGFVEFMTQQPINPPLHQIIEKFGLEKSLKVIPGNTGEYIVEINKDPSQILTFGQYQVQTSVTDKRGYVNSEYSFE